MFGSWNKTDFGQVEEWISQVRRNLKMFKQLRSLHFIEDVEKERKLRFKLEELLDQEHIRWAQDERYRMG